MEPFEVYFDFTCRFANRLHLWLGTLDVDADSFVRFTEIPDIDDGPTILAALQTLAERAPGLDHLEPLRG